MNHYFRIFSGILFCLLLSIPSFGQFDLSQPAPIDPEVRMGVLDNGLTYYIRHNQEPEKRASFYIIQNVGAILENDDQNGLAHFLEHMSFNGTGNFPGKAIINSLEKHGVAFGYNINAYTSFDETVYNLSDVPIENQGLLDTCLLILHDWSDYVTLDGKEIDLERGVISEEWRTSKTAARRMVFTTIPVILEGSMYAKRDIIGDINVIKNFEYQTIRDFYHDWYRTDLQAIAIVGDINVDDVEAKVKKLFSEIPAVGNPRPRVNQVIPYHADTRYVLAQDKEASSSSVEIVALHEGTPNDKKNLDYIRDQHLLALMNSMASARIDEILQKENPPFVSGSIYYGDNYARGYKEFSIYATPRPNEEELAFKAIYTEAERIKRYGFTEGELDRAKAIMLAEYENQYNQKDKIHNETYIATIQSHFLANEPLTSIDFDYSYANLVMPSISAAEITARFREVMIDENRTIVVMGLEGENINHLTKDEALSIISDVKNSTLEPYVDVNLGKSLVENEPEGSKIIKTTPLPQFDAVEWTLGNNAKVIFRKADYEKDNVLLDAYSFGGMSNLDENLVMPAYLLSSLTSMYGVGEFDNITLQKMMAGKKASVEFSVSETFEEISGSSTPKDFETMMQLLYMKFTQPRFDETAHKSYMERFIAQVNNMEKDPNKIMNDSISLITTQYSKRTPILNQENLSKVTVDDVQKVYSDRFNGADEFTFIIVGNIDENTVIPLVEKYIGGLPASGRNETYTDRKIGQPKGQIDKYIRLNLTIPKATVFLSLEKDIEYTPQNVLGLSVINGILDIVYTEKVREEEGGTYGVGVSISTRKTPSPRAETYITFDCDPDRADELKTIIYRELNNLAKDGPSRENLDKTALNILKTREESKLHNSYWLTSLIQYYRLGMNFNDPANYEDVIKSFTVKDIKKIAKSTFKKQNVADMVFSPAE